jgi:hypothetical protein
MADSTEPAHNAFTLKREGMRYGRWLEIGAGRLDSAGVFHGNLDRLPIGGFNGYVHFTPIGTEPQLPEPERPAKPSDDEGEIG